MSKRELDEAVRDYLAHTGGSEAETIWRGLGADTVCKVAEVRSACKRIGAVAMRSVNSWETMRTTPHVDKSLRTAQKFTVYLLAREVQENGPTGAATDRGQH